MGRHSLPGPENSADQPSDEDAGDYSDPDDAHGEGPDEGLGDDEPSGRHAVTGYEEPDEPTAAGAYGDYFGEQRYSVGGSQYSAGDGGDS
ncbi:MAG: hypothetical protein WCB92_01450, partial [Mycobacterium sp.]